MRSDRVLAVGTVLDSLSDLFGLRLPLPLQSRPAQISAGTQDSTNQFRLPKKHSDSLLSTHEGGRRETLESANKQLILIYYINNIK